MSAKADALRFLEEIQQHYRSNGGVTPLRRRYRYQQKKPFTEAGFLAVGQAMRAKGYVQPLSDYQQFMQEIEAVRKDYSSLEEPTNISMLESLKAAIKEVFSLNREPFPENVVIGTAQFGQVNAFATSPSPGSDIKVILMDDGLFIFLNGLSKIISMLFEKKTDGDEQPFVSIHPDDIDEQLAKNGQAHELFRDLMVNYFVTGHSGYSKKYILEQEHNVFADRLRQTAELFILAHEYGHVVNNHLDGDAEEEESLDEQLHLKTWPKSWSRERQADLFALMIVMRYNRYLQEMTIEMSYAGIAMLFTTLEMLSVAKGGPYVPSLTHPAPGQRNTYLFESLGWDSPDKSLIDGVLLVKTAFIQVIHRLWEMNRDLIKPEIARALAG